MTEVIERLIQVLINFFILLLLLKVLVPSPMEDSQDEFLLYGGLSLPIDEVVNELLVVAKFGHVKVFIR